MWQSGCCDVCANIFLEDSIMKHNFEISYTQQGDYLLPDLRLPEQPKVHQAAPQNPLYHSVDKLQAHRLPRRHRRAGGGYVLSVGKTTRRKGRRD